MKNIINNKHNLTIDRDYPKFRFQKSEWKILSDNEADMIIQSEMNPSKIRGEIFMLNEMWNLQLIEKAEASFLLEPKYFKNKKGEEFHSMLSFYERVEQFYDENLSIRIYSRYPFSKYSELTIPPICQTNYFESVETVKVIPIGYIAWQSSKLLVSLLSEEYEEDEIGNILGDLQLTSFRIYDGNVFYLEISS